jgi:uncharacterized protein
VNFARLEKPFEDLQSFQPFYVAQSKVHGFGVFASCDLPAGKAIVQLRGTVASGSNALSDPDYIGIGPDIWIDPDHPLDYINHSCEPNCAFGVKRVLVTTSSILRDEELLIDYSATELDESWTLECGCGTPSCRGTLRAMQLTFPDLTKPPHASPLLLRFWRKALRGAL